MDVIRLANRDADGKGNGVGQFITEILFVTHNSRFAYTGLPGGGG
jgi:hypothetical protein